MPQNLSRNHYHLVHDNCGNEVTIAVLNDDVALYVYCDVCNDIVEDGELRNIRDTNAQKIKLVLDE